MRPADPHVDGVLNPLAAPWRILRGRQTSPVSGGTRAPGGGSPGCDSPGVARPLLGGVPAQQHGFVVAFTEPRGPTHTRLSQGKGYHDAPTTNPSVRSHDAGDSGCPRCYRKRIDVSDPPKLRMDERHTLSPGGVDCRGLGLGNRGSPRRLGVQPG